MPRPANGPYLRVNPRGIYIIHHTEQGRSRTLSTRSTDPAEAQRALAEYILGLREIRREEGIPVADAWALYWSEHVARKVTDQARLEYCWKALAPVLGSLFIQKLTADDFEKYIARREATVKSPTVRRELSALTACFNHLVKTKRLSPAELPYIPVPAASAPRDRWLTVEEMDHLRAVVRTRADRSAQKAPRRLSRLERFLEIALATGARRKVIERLTWFRVDLQRGLIDFNDGGPATKKRKPVVPVSDALAITLRRAYAERTGPWVLDTSGAIRKAFDTACREAGLLGVHRHTLRHTWATHASMAGVSLVDISRVLGNSLAMVTKVYAHHQPEYLRQAVNFTPISYQEGVLR